MSGLMVFHLREGGPLIRWYASRMRITRRARSSKIRKCFWRIELQRSWKIWCSCDCLWGETCRPARSFGLRLAFLSWHDPPKSLPFIHSRSGGRIGCIHQLWRFEDSV